MKEKKSQKVCVRDLVDKYQENCDRISTIAETCEQENRERTEAEDAEYVALTRDNQLLQMKMQALAAENLRQNPNIVADANRMIRENLEAGRQTRFMLMRDLMMVSDVASGGVVPLRVQDILEPLEEGLIINKLGLPMPTGLSGDFVWPMYEAVDATIAGEGVELSDTKIPFSKLTAQPERIGIAIPVTRQSLIQSDGILEVIVKKLIPHSVTRLLNKIVCSTTKVTGATNLIGPFALIAGGTATMSDGKTKNAVKNVSAIPTFDELNQIKAKLLETGIDGEALCWVLTKSMAATLEGQPINKDGIFIPMLQNGILCGLPVFTTNEIRNGATEYIGLGDWRYQPMGLFGDISFVIDPYSQARKDAVDFVLNVNYGTKTLRTEAFALAKVAAKS